MADPIIEGGIRVLAQTHSSSSDEEVISANSFVFGMFPAGPTTETAMSDAADAVKAFYNDIAADLSKHVGFVSFKAYDLGEPTPRTPLEIGGLTAASSGASLPSEVASCLSYWNGVVPRPRKRGRIFIGPLKASVIDNTPNVPRVSSGHRTSVTSACVTHFSGMSGLKWGLLSQTLGVIWTIDSVYMDDAFDIQRRRGEDPSTKTVAAI
jgi:hypothetical protein